MYLRVCIFIYLYISLYLYILYIFIFANIFKQVRKHTLPTTLKKEKKEEGEKNTTTPQPVGVNEIFFLSERKKKP